MFWVKIFFGLHIKFFIEEIGNKAKKIEIEAMSRKSAYSGKLICMIKVQ